MNAYPYRVLAVLSEIPKHLVGAAGVLGAYGYGWVRRLLLIIARLVINDLKMIRIWIETQEGH